MRHGRAHRKLGSVADHRIAMLRNQAQDLLRHERIRTTVPRAKELRRSSSASSRSPSGVSPTATADRGVTARRLVARDIADRSVVVKLFERIAPRFAERPGGYTRLLRLGNRRGDDAEVAQVERSAARHPSAVTATRRVRPVAEEGQGVGGRLRAAAERLRGRRRKARAPRATPSRRRRSRKAPAIEGDETAAEPRTRWRNARPEGRATPSAGPQSPSRT